MANTASNFCFFCAFASALDIVSVVEGAVGLCEGNNRGAYRRGRKVVPPLPFRLRQSSISTVSHRPTFRWPSNPFGSSNGLPPRRSWTLRSVIPMPSSVTSPVSTSSTERTMPANRRNILLDALAPRTTIHDETNLLSREPSHAEKTCLVIDTMAGNCTPDSLAMYTFRTLAITMAVTSTTSVLLTCITTVQGNVARGMRTTADPRKQLRFHIANGLVRLQGVVPPAPSCG